MLSISGADSKPSSLFHILTIKFLLGVHFLAKFNLSSQYFTLFIESSSIIHLFFIAFISLVACFIASFILSFDSINSSALLYFLASSASHFNSSGTFPIPTLSPALGFLISQRSFPICPIFKLPFLLWFIFSILPLKGFLI